MLKIEHLTKEFGNQKALNNLSSSVTEPGVNLFIGSNGSGKSTLFNAITGLLSSFEGTVTLNGEIDADKRRTLCGIATEPFHTEPNLTVQEIVDISLQVKKAKPSDARQWIKFWELEAGLEKPFKALSTGMKKRLSLVLSLIGNPDYLFWDEPFNGIDPLGIDKLNQLISELMNQGKYLFLSTHLLNELQGVNASCFIMTNGMLIEQIRNTTINEDTRKTILELLKTGQ